MDTKKDTKKEEKQNSWLAQSAPVQQHSQSSQDLEPLPFCSFILVKYIWLTLYLGQDSSSNWNSHYKIGSTAEKEKWRLIPTIHWHFPLLAVLNVNYTSPWVRGMVKKPFTVLWPWALLRSPASLPELQGESDIALPPRWWLLDQVAASASGTPECWEREKAEKYLYFCVKLSIIQQFFFSQYKIINYRHLPVSAGVGLICHRGYQWTQQGGLPTVLLTYVSEYSPPISVFRVCLYANVNWKKDAGWRANIVLFSALQPIRASC